MIGSSIPGSSSEIYSGMNRISVTSTNELTRINKTSPSMGSDMRTIYPKD